MMLQFLALSRTLDKQLAALRKQGKKAELAAAKCEEILAAIRAFGWKAEAIAGKRTHNGELRIKNCVKYDLGGGYRLITVRAGGHLLVPFAGTHDETDQWIERHRGEDFAFHRSSYRQEAIGKREMHRQETELEDGIEQDDKEEDTDGYEDALLRRLDETRLKSVFRGLYATPPPAAGRSGGAGGHRG